MKEQKPTRGSVAELTAILIDIYERFPEYLKDVSPNDPDLDMDRGFETYNELERMANARKLYELQQQCAEVNGHKEAVND